MAAGVVLLVVLLLRQLLVEPVAELQVLVRPEQQQQRLEVHLFTMLLLQLQAVSWAAKVVVQLLRFIQQLLVLLCVLNLAVLQVLGNLLQVQVLAPEEAVYGEVVVVVTEDATVLHQQH